MAVRAVSLSLIKILNTSMVNASSTTKESPVCQLILRKNDPAGGPKTIDDGE